MFLEDIEDDFPTICVNPASVRLSSMTVAVKDEPLSDPDSPASSCPTSPIPDNFRDTQQEIDIEMDTEMVKVYQYDLVIILLIVSKLLLQLENLSQGVMKQNSFDTQFTRSLFGQQRITIPKLNIKVEPNTGMLILDIRNKIHLIRFMQYLIFY